MVVAVGEAADPLVKELVRAADHLTVGAGCDAKSGMGPVITEESKKEMRAILRDIQTGKFTSAWIQECKAGQPRFKATRRVNDAHPIEAVGEKLRGMMPWIKAKALVDKSRN